MKITQRSDYTFKYNKKLGRHGWLRLTPAYSVKLVTEIIDNIPEGGQGWESNLKALGYTDAEYFEKLYCHPLLQRFFLHT